MVSFLISLAMLALTTAMFFGFDQFAGEFDWASMKFDQFNYDMRYVWIESLGIHWSVGMDALSFPMVAHHLPVASDHRGHVEREERRRLLPAHPLDGWSAHRRVRRFGLVHVLRVLGIDLDSDVLPHP